jgi:hypothetical protein
LDKGDPPASPGSLGGDFLFRGQVSMPRGLRRRALPGSFAFGFLFPRCLRIAGSFPAKALQAIPLSGEPQMARYGKKAASKVKRAMHERKAGSLRSGRSGRKVKSKKQAIAIGLSEARRSGAKVPQKKKSGARKKK